MALEYVYGYKYIVNMTPIIIRLRELRRAKGWSQTELASRAGVRQATISSLERGPVKKLDMIVLEKLAAALEVDPGYLIVRIPENDGN